MRKQHLNRSTILRLPLRIDPASVDRILGQGALVLETSGIDLTSRAIGLVDGIKEVVDIDPDTLQRLHRHVNMLLDQCPRR